MDISQDLDALLDTGWLVPVADRPIGVHRVLLHKPVKHGAQTVEVVSIDPARGIHARNAPAPAKWETLDALLEMAGRLTGQPDGVLDQLEAEDLGAVVDGVTRQLWPLLELPAGRSLLPAPHAREVPILPAPYTIGLNSRVRDGEDTLSSLTFNAITGKVARRLPNRLELSDLPGLVVALTGISPAAFDRLEGIDLNRTLAVAQCFFVATRRSGRGSSPSSLPGITGPPEP